MMAKIGVSLICLVFYFAFSLVQAQSISLEELGSLELSYIQPRKVASYEGSSLPAQITGLPGNDYWVSAPENIQQVTFLVGQGQHVGKGQAVARLTGPEVFHYIAQVEATKNLYELAKQRYDRNKPLLKKGSISRDVWRQISQEYFAAHLEYEHMQHFMEMVQTIDAESESLVISAPIDGIAIFNPLNRVYSAGTQLFSILPSESVRIRVNVPMSQSTSLSAVNVNQCHIAIEQVSAIADGVFLTAWSTPIPSQCHLLLGQQITVIPEYQKAVYMLPKDSIFTWQQESQVFIQSAAHLSALSVDILGSTPDEYIVASDQDLSQLKVLSQSVAAVKGILLGLGGE